MTLSTLLVVILILVLLGGVFPWGPGPAAPGTGTRPAYPGYGYGLPLGGVLGTVLIIVLILALIGRL